MTNPEGSQTVYRCPDCGAITTQQGYPRRHRAHFRHGKPEPIEVLPLTAVQERERELVEALEWIAAHSYPPDGEWDEWGEPTYDEAGLREIQKRARAALAYHRRESEDE